MVHEFEELQLREQVTGRINVSRMNAGIQSAMYQYFYGCHCQEKGFVAG